jgi:hypothetical protein
VLTRQNGTKLKKRGKHLQYLKMLSSSLRRNILADPLVDLAMHASRSHPVSMIRLKPLPYPLLAVSVLANSF